MEKEEKLLKETGFEIKEITPKDINEDVDSFAARMLDLVKTDNKKVIGTYNGVTFEVLPDDKDITVGELSRKFDSIKIHRVLEENNKVEKRTRQLTETAIESIDKLSQLDFTNLNDVINWMDDFQSIRGVSYDKDKIVSIFQKNGFNAGMNTGKNFDGENKENYAKWLIGQALKGLINDGQVAQMFSEYAEKWKKKFGELKDQEEIEKIRKELEN